MGSISSELLTGTFPREAVYHQLYNAAAPLLGRFELGREDMSCGKVAAALLTDEGNIYTGICVELNCGLGFCAEQAAAAEMLKARESRVIAALAIKGDRILPACGRCREFLMQLNFKNKDTKIFLPDRSCVSLEEMLPAHWMQNPIPDVKKAIASDC